ncbi:MAG: c-type cytochrome [Ferruginibacter sp.]|nr:c-type cytochrome [Ferruginibacter sp.]
MSRKNQRWRRSVIKLLPLWSRSFLLIKNWFTGCFFIGLFSLVACHNQPAEKIERTNFDYIKPITGANEVIAAGVVEKGEVLISYSDCYTCHKLNERSVGPAFKDIAKRYPTNKIYIEMLARKVIKGGSRSWGYPVMSPHPTLVLEDAKMMTAYILSLKE